MDPTAEGSGVRVLEGAGALARAGEEAAALGTRALVISPAQPEPRQASHLARLAHDLRSAHVGHQPFPRVPRPGSPVDGCLGTAAEAAREGHCRLVIGVGDAEPLDVARGTAAAALLPCMLIPTAVGYGHTAASERFPFPDVLLLDPQAGAGSPPRRTATLGVATFMDLLERYAAAALPQGAAAELLESAMRSLVDHLPAAVRAPDDLAARVGLAAAAGRGVEGMSAAGPGPAPATALAERLSRGGDDLTATRVALLPAMLEVSSSVEAGFDPQQVARFGRRVLGIREADDGRAAAWAAGGVRQWFRNLGFATRLPAARPVPGQTDDTIRAILAAARR